MNRIIFSFVIFIIITLNTVRAEEIKNNELSRNLLLEEGSDNLITIINFLESKGYRISKKSPSFFSIEAYNMVYFKINKEGYTGFVITEEFFVKDTKVYKLVYELVYALNKPNDPNYFVYVSFVFDNKIFWFYCVNSFLEYDIERKWVFEDGSEKIIKMFY